MADNQSPLYRIDSRYFKAFMAVAQTNSFTLGAEKMGMTQSVVSNHISTLEHQVRKPLFTRSHKQGKDARLTVAGEAMFRYISREMGSMGLVFAEITKDYCSLVGSVRVAIPLCSYQAPWFKSLLEGCREFPGLSLSVEMTSDDEVLDSVKAGHSHFGLTTTPTDIPELRYQKVYLERYLAVGRCELNSDLPIADALLEQRLVLYPEINEHLKLWLSHHTPDRPRLALKSFQKTADINCLQGAVEMVRHGHGFSVFPEHSVQSLVDRGEIKPLLECGEPNCGRWVYLVYSTKFDHTRRVHVLMDLVSGPEECTVLKDPETSDTPV